MFSQLSNNSKGIILAIIGFSAFALADANAKYLTQHYEPAYVVGTVAIFSSSLCLILSPFLGGFKRTIRTKKLKFHIWRGLMNVMSSLLVVLSFSKLTLSGSYTIIFLAPLIVSLMAVFFMKEKIHWQGWVAIVAGFSGILLVIRPGAEDFNPFFIIPLAAAFFVALLLLSARPLDKEESLVSLALFPTWTNFVVITPSVIWLYGLPALHDLPHFIFQAAMVIIGLIFTGLAFRTAKTAIVGPFLYTEMIWAIGFDTYIFNTPPDLWTLAGGGIIIASGIYLIETERRIAAKISIP